MSDFALPAASLAQSRVVPIGVSKTISGTAGIGQAPAVPTVGANAGRLPPSILPRILTGNITSAGGITSGTGFTISHAGTGLYDIVYTKPFGVIPITLVLPTDSGNIAFKAFNNATTGCRVNLYDFAGTNVDKSFMFVIVAIQ